MRIKYVKFDCEVCGKSASIQVFYNKAGIAKYARARHYIGRVNGKPQFEYHQQSLVYIQNIFGYFEIGHGGHVVNDDLEKLTFASKIHNKSWGWELNPYIAALQATA